MSKIFQNDLLKVSKKSSFENVLESFEFIFQGNQEMYEVDWFILEFSIINKPLTQQKHVIDVH